MADDPCEESGWGVGPYGVDPWAAPVGFDPGGPIPSVAPYTLYCVGPCGPITVLDTYNEVSEVYQAGQLTSTVPFGDDLRLYSGGGTISDDTVSLRIAKSTPQNWTIEFSFSFDRLPDNFNNLPLSHAYVGVASTNACSAGLFFSKQGILYTGSILHGVGNVLVPNHPIQILPNSLGLVPEDTYMTVRIAVDEETRTTFIYVTESAQVPISGHQLRWVVEAYFIDGATDTPQDGTHISVKGTPLAPTILDLNSICMGPGALIPNLPPIADAGRDFSAQRCSIIRLNGELSRDPEEVPVTYFWRLVDAPETSREVIAGDDGITVTPTPLTNKFYSAQLELEHDADPIEVGDVLQVGTLFLDISSIGEDGGGFYVIVSEFSLPAPTTSSSFKVLRQRGLSGARTVNPTFYLDVTGVFRFSLQVSDGQLFSEASDVVSNSVESEIARGVVPDLNFAWSYLSNVWNLVDDKAPITEFWSAVAQITAAELLSLWHHDSAKGLKNITRLFQRKWLHYDLYVAEPYPDLTEVPFLTHGILSSVIPLAGIDLQGQYFGVEFLGGVAGGYFTGGNLTAEKIAAQLRTILGTSFTVTVIPFGVDAKIRVTAARYFEVVAASTASLFTPGMRNLPIAGTGGAAVGTRGYRVDESLLGVGVVAGDYLILRGQAYRIVTLLSDPSDLAPFQRILLETAPPIAAGAEWRIARPVKSKFLDFHGMLASNGDIAHFEIQEVATSEILPVQATVWGAPASIKNNELLVDCAELLPFLSAPAYFRVRLTGVRRRTYVPIDVQVAEIPYLQEILKPKDDSEILRQNIDFFIEEYRGRPCIRFVSGGPSDPDIWEHLAPPDRLWAEVTYLDNRPTIEGQYGRPVDFTLDDLEQLPPNTDYLSVVRGLWFSYLNGPTLRNLRVGTQILLGLPFAEEDGVIMEIDERFSPNQGRLLVRDTNPPNIVRAYTYPRGLKLEVNPDTQERYVVGDTTPQFAPLVEGVEILDYIKDETWWASYQQQGAMFEVEKFFKFLVRVDSEAFSLPTLLFVKSFILRVKPTYSYPLFVVRRRIADATFEIIDRLSMLVRLRLFDGLCNARGLGYMFDDPDPSGGGFMAQFDSGAPLTGPPSFPTPAAAVYWGYDHEIICPQDYITGELEMTLVAPTAASYDGLYLFDSGLYTSTLLDEGTAGILSFVPNPGIYLGRPVTSAGNYSVVTMSVRVDAPFSIPAAVPVNFYIEVNGVVVDTIPFTVPASGGWQGFLPLSGTVLVTPGDVVRVRVASVGAAAHVEWVTLAVRLGAVYTWTLDSNTPAGTYTVTRQM